MKQKGIVGLNPRDYPSRWEYRYAIEERMFRIIEGYESPMWLSREGRILLARLRANAITILSDNEKAGESIGWGVLSCDLTRCQYCRSHGCYCAGFHNMLEKALLRCVFTLYLARKYPSALVERIVRWLPKRPRYPHPLRVSETGDIFYPGQVRVLRELSKRGVEWYGYTRIESIVSTFPNNMLLSVWQGEPREKDLLRFAERKGFDVSYVRLPHGDPSVPGPVTVSFPLHGSGKKPSRIPYDPKDCPSIRKRCERCRECRRCY